MKNAKKILLGSIIALGASAASAFAQATDPNTVVSGASTTATTAWTGFAVLSASAFVFAMVIGYSRKGKK